MTALLFVGLFIVLLALGVPVAFAMLGTTIVYLLLTGAPNELVVQRFISGLESFPLLAIPFFVLAGVVMTRSGIAERIIGFANSLVGHMRGGLGQVNVLNSVIMGGMSGSGTADAAVDSKVIVPEMVRRGYAKPFAAAVTATSGVMSALIPPSIVLILYALQTGVSVGRLFIAGLAPALLMALSIAVTVWIISVRRGYQPTSGGWSLRETARQFLYAFWALAMIGLLLIGLRMGVFTPTELGAVAAGYTLIIALFVYRTIRFRDLLGVLREAATLTASIMLILGAATAFGYFVTVERLPRQVAELMTGLTTDPALMMILIVMVLLLIGTIMESASLIIIMAPLLAPLAVEIGADPVHFGVVVVAALAVGGTTPPVGSVLFTVMTITGVKLGALSRALAPFLLALFIALIVIAMVPALTLYLPSIFFR